jgi:hypothetical protein
MFFSFLLHLFSSRTIQGGEPALLRPCLLWVRVEIMGPGSMKT